MTAPELGALVGLLVGLTVLLTWRRSPLTRIEPESEGMRLWEAAARQWRRWRARARPDPSAAELPQVLELMAVCLDAGAPLNHAVATVRSLSPPASAAVLARVISDLDVGRDPSDAWRGLARHPTWGPVALDLARSLRSGSGMAEGLRVHADEARRRRRDAAMRSARGVGVKSVQPLVVCFLPAFVLLGVVPLIASLLEQFLVRS